jgi:MFS family permease
LAERSEGLAPLILVAVLHNVQMNMVRPFVPLFAASLGADYVVIGALAAAVGFLPLIFAIPVGRRTDRWGVRTVVAVGAVANAMGMLLLCALPGIPTLLVAQLVAGLANLLVGLSVQARIGALGKGAIAVRNFSSLTLFTSVGQIGGPLLGGVVVGLFGFGGVFAVAAAFSVACCLTALLTPRLPSRQRRAVPTGPHRAGRARHYLRQRETQLAILASCLMSVPEILRTSFLPLYLGRVVGLDAAYIGYVIAIFAVAGLVAKLVLPKSVARFGRYTMLFWFTGGCALTLLVLPLVTSVWGVAAVTAAMGLTFGLGRPVSMAIAANAATPGEEGFVVALRLSGNRAADFVLPVAFGAVAGAAGLGAVFMLGALLLLAGAGALAGPVRDERRRD